MSRCIPSSLVAVTLLAFAGPTRPARAQSSANKGSYCLARWPRANKTSAAWSRSCARYLLLRAYDAKPSELKESLEHDPPVPAGLVLRLSGSQLKRAAGHVKGVCGKGGCELAKQPILARAEELLLGAAGEHTGLYDNIGGGGVGPDLRPLLEIIAAGKRLQADSIPKLSAVALRKLRNAPYARHGRSFKNKDLDAFFFDRRDKKGILPFTRKADFSAKKLTAADRANIKLLRKRERAALKKQKRW